MHIEATDVTGGALKSVRSFRAEWRISLLTALLLPGLLALGMWQLERAAEKRVLAAKYAAQSAASVIDYRDLNKGDNDQLYRRVETTGYFLRVPTVFLDNKMRGGRFGYEVVSGFRVDGLDAILLVNRGWIAGDPGRRELPDVEFPEAEVTIRGHLYVPPGAPYLLEVQEVPTQWPVLQQALDGGLLGQALAVEIYPYSLRLDSGVVGALTTDWQILNASPDRHQAYAVQWFAMALALLFIYLWRGFAANGPDIETGTATKPDSELES
ncbi:MAG: surfeit locus 1 family protein [Halieaceae bacterium]